MKTRFNTYDIVCSCTELQKLIGMRVNQVYDIDNKTYLIRLNRNEEKDVLLLESGNRLHKTSFEWPKSVAPSGFTMKLRKHLKNKRLEKLTQLGVDRIVHMQFGTNEATYHVILELYDRGNIILCDYEWTILNVLRPHIEGEELRFAVREKYPLDRARPDTGPPSMEEMRNILSTARPGDTLRTVLNPVLAYGPSVIDHVLFKYGLNNCRIGGELPEEEGGGQKKKNRKKNKENSQATKVFDMDVDFTSLINAVNDGEKMLRQAMTATSKGYLLQKREVRPNPDSDGNKYYFTNVEYHPFLSEMNKNEPFKEFGTFTEAVDEFYSSMESQKIDLKSFQQEREALKKLSNVKTDHAKRLTDLSKAQVGDRKKAELITRNQGLVDNAILAIQSALANQMSWTDIQDLVKAAQVNNDPVAKCIKQLKLEMNHISLYLTDPYETADNDLLEEGEEPAEDDETLTPMVLDVDLGLSAYANATRFYDQKRNAAKKEQKTIESSSKALKSAERKTQQTLKDVRTQTSITKARKFYWFEKFYWFISSENYLVIGGRDQQQNELIVKRYMHTTDVYVHAEIQGASSVLIKNPGGGEIPPKTLLEAGTMAISYSVAWDAKVVTSAYWVYSDQVSKTAPTGEYLSTGSFMIRGKKNFLPPCHLVLGLSFLFKLEDESVARHKGERRVRGLNDDDDLTENKKLEEERRLRGLNDDDELLEEDEDLLEGDFPGEDLSSTDGDKDLNRDEGIAEATENLDLKEPSEEKNESSEDEDNEPHFPDTHVNIEHDTGKVTVTADPKLERLTSEHDADAAERTVFLGDDKPYIIQPKLSKKQKQQQKSKKPPVDEAAPVKKDEPEAASGEKTGAQTQMKRRQKGKLKKIKEKYGDQDEEERKMRMDILKSSGTDKLSRRNKKEEDQQMAVKKKAQQLQQRTLKMNAKPGETEVVDDSPAAADVDMVDSLTGNPHDEDELLFAVPVIAPYQTLQSYKYKVKLTPGSGKRGRAAKLALQMFLKDKACTQREKDLLKAVKDETLARNIPGKVKLSAPQLHRAFKAYKIYK